MQKLYADMSYESVVREYARAVASACVMRTGNWADAEDCFQNTFEKLFISAPEFKDADHLKAWLLRVAINECRTLQRRSARTVPLETAESIPVFMRDEPESFPAVLMRVKPKYREALYLYYCEEYKIDEVAEILKKNPNTVKTLLRRGREQLKLIYGGEQFD